MLTEEKLLQTFDVVFKFQWHIKKHQFNALNLAPELITMSQLRLKIHKQPEDTPVSPI